MLKNHRHFILTALWILITLAITGWWIYFTMSGFEKWATHPLTPEQVVRYKRMFTQEGIFFVFMLLIGGGALFFSAWRIESEKERVKKFFVVFTHDLKTAITRLRLQTDLIAEGQEDLPHRVIQVQEEAMRLQVQLENALWLTRGFGDRKVFERRNWKDFIESLQNDWPLMRIKSMPAREDAETQTWFAQLQLDMDRRLFQNIFQNIIQNAWVHGEATEMIITVDEIKKATATQSALLSIVIIDNGKGYSGEIKKLGHLFARHTPSSGTGVGLHIVRESVRQLGGTIGFNKSDKNQFLIQLQIPQFQKSLATQMKQATPSISLSQVNQINSVDQFKGLKDRPQQGHEKG